MGKIKVSVTIDERLLEEAERHAGEGSRSQIVESALAAWVRARRRRSLDEEIERYYLGLSEEERAEDEGWARIGEETLRRAGR